MTSLFQNLLIIHILTGVFAIISSYAVWLKLLKKDLSISKLKSWSLSAVIFYFVSWLTSGYYYTQFYGSKVKPIIKSGDYPFAHSLFMESKEHLFLFLPILAIVLYTAITFGSRELQGDQKYRKKVVLIAGFTVVIGILITLSGVIISGAAR